MAFNNVFDSWIQGVGIDGGAEIDSALGILEARNLTLRNNWWGPLAGGGVYTTTSYGISLVHCSGCLIENNIFQAVESPLMLNAGTTGSVLSYNYEAETGSYEGGLQMHQPGSAMNLYEGNSFTKFWADFFHGNTVLNTLYRNHFFSGRGVDLSSYQRWFNAVGNVINATVYQAYVTTPPYYSRFDDVAFRLGYPSQNASPATTNGVAADPVVIASSMRWGNYVTTSGTHWLPAEVPSADPLFPNPVPASPTLPASFYHAARPPWWPAGKAWPPIGPDVIGGSIPGYGNHAHTLPAEDCYLAAGQNMANFSPGSCYPVPVELLSVYDVTVLEGDSGATQATFPVSLSAPSAQTVSVSYQTANGTATAGSDYTAVSGTLTFAPGVTSRTVNVPVLGDTLIETDETFFLNLSAPTNATLADPQGLGTISDDDAPSLSGLELTHGSLHVQDLSAASGPAGGQDAYRLAQHPRSSYEVALDGISGDVTPLVLQRLAADNLTVLQSATSVGTGSSVRLRFENASAAPVLNQPIRVLSGACTSGCGTADAYRIRAWDTTGTVPRFNNSGSQVTVLLLQNREAFALNGHVDFWSGAGTLLASQVLALGPRQTLVLSTASVPGLAGQGGSITVSHDGGYGALAGKAVAVEPATGFTFDSPLETRAR